MEPANEPNQRASQSAVKAGALQIPTPVCVIPASIRVIPAKAGIQYMQNGRIPAPWIPACAGKTQEFGHEATKRKSEG